MSRKKYTIEDMHELAKKHNGICLSEKYSSRKEKIEWQCEKGHVFKKAAGPIIDNNQWCPVCAEEGRKEKRKLSLETVAIIGREKGLELLDKHYENSSQKLHWQCEKGHKFTSNITAIRLSKIGCPQCRANNRQAHNKLPNEYFNKYAKDRDGIFLGSNDNNLQFQCNKGHIWETSRSSILSKSWCPTCSYKERGTRKKNDISIYQDIAKERGGILLSKSYKRNNEKLEWQCSNGHIWEASAGSIKSGSWCPICSSGLGERICRIYFETIFKETFKKEFPKWLINDRGNQMELDGYNERLKIAFEHQGEQHFSLKTKYIRNNEQLTKRIKDDELKAKLCEENGIALFQIPSIMQNIGIEKVIDVIIEESNRLSVLLPENIKSIDIDYYEAYKVDYHIEKLEEIRKIADEKNGKCHSPFYINDRTKLLFECKEGHQWHATPKDIFNGHWCRNCAAKERANKSKLTISDINQRISNFAHCISKEYKGYDVSLRFRCNVGHEFTARPRRILMNGFCPICNNLKKARINMDNIDDLNKIAESKRGKLLSTEYENEKKELKWQCEKGHIWLAPAERIRNSNSWCSVCARNQAFGIDYVNNYIKEKYEGECLSTEYKNYRSILTFKCKRGHVWEAPFINIKRGSWCKECKKTETV